MRQSTERFPDLTHFLREDGPGFFLDVFFSWTLLERAHRIQQSLLRCVFRLRCTRKLDCLGDGLFWFSTCPLYPAVTRSVTASPEELRKIGLVWEMTS